MAYLIQRGLLVEVDIALRPATARRLRKDFLEEVVYCGVPFPDSKSFSEKNVMISSSLAYS